MIERIDKETAAHVLLADDSQSIKVYMDNITAICGSLACKIATQVSQGNCSEM